MKSYRVAKAAERDLDAIFVFWAQRAGLDVADRLIDEITARFSLLGAYSEAGIICPAIAPRVRCFPAGNYLLYYRKTRGGIDILHVFHSKRDQKKAWKSQKS